jgi:hypothetical protein
MKIAQHRLQAFAKYFCILALVLILVVVIPAALDLPGSAASYPGYIGFWNLVLIVPPCSAGGAFIIALFAKAPPDHGDH